MAPAFFPRFCIYLGRFHRHTVRLFPSHELGARPMMPPIILKQTSQKKKSSASARGGLVAGFPTALVAGFPVGLAGGWSAAQGPMQQQSERAVRQLRLASALPCSLFPPRLYMYIDRTACSLAGYIHIQHAVPVWKICIAHATQGVWHELGHEQVRSRPTQFSWRTRSCRPSTMNPFIPAHVHPGFTFLFS